MYECVHTCVSAYMCWHVCVCAYIHVFARVCVRARPTIMRAYGMCGQNTIQNYI